MPFATIQRVLEPAEEDRKAILEPLLAYNLAKAGEEHYKRLALFLRDNGNEIQGGLWAKLYYDWLFVDLLFVPEAMRGENLGSKLLRDAEDWAKVRVAKGLGSIPSRFRLLSFTRSKAMMSLAHLRTILGRTAGFSCVRFFDIGAKQLPGRPRLNSR